MIFYYAAGYFTIGMLYCISARNAIAKETGWFAIALGFLYFCLWPIMFGGAVVEHIIEGDA